MMKKTDIVSYSYKAFRTVASAFYHLRYDVENAELFKKSSQSIPKNLEVDAGFFREYKKRWLPWSSSFFLSRREIDLYCYLGNRKRLDYIPWNVWYTTVDLTLNNKELAWAYAEKGNYKKLYGIDNEPLSFFRFLNGLSYDAFGGVIKEPETFFEAELGRQTKILVKPVIDSWGGKSVLVFERDSKGVWQCVNEQVELSFKQLLKYYQKNFVVQEFMDSHPFYERFNSTSFNTVRIYVYRSPKDEQVHVLHTVLKAGGKGNVVDNIGAGGHAFYILEDGKFLYGRSSDMKRIEEVPDGSGQPLKELPKVPGIDEIKALARKIALQTPFHRLLAMDVNIDSSGTPRLIELNLSEAGSGVQLFGFPFLGPFTDEVIEYCKSHKKNDYLKF